MAKYRLRFAPALVGAAPIMIEIGDAGIRMPATGDAAIVRVVS